MCNQEEIMIQLSEVNNFEQELANQLTESVMQMPNLQECSYLLTAMSLQSDSANIIPCSIDPFEFDTCTGSGKGLQDEYCQ
ncbi:hypothetical protein [Anabaena azotica]|uniref:hypothetical protein n=1 Tax=Anabaena azotica TaxID=197653 RepID=UPI0039A75C61